MNKIRLGVNIDHVATIRNARGECYPEPLKAALVAEKNGADSITIHLREDRRHIREVDLKKIKKKLKVPLNLEMAPTHQMLNLAKKYKPNFVCLVPEKRKEITTEGGLNLKKNVNLLKKIIYQLHDKRIRVSLFIEPTLSAVKQAKILKSDCIELHTGKYCSSLKKKNKEIEYKKLKRASIYVNKLGLEVHAGHGLTYNTAFKVSKIDHISELNIGHFIISESIFIGLKNSIKKFKKMINK